MCVILVLCSANQCRSPMTAALLTRHLSEADITAAVSSAGMLPGGAPPPPAVLDAIDPYGIDLTSHRSHEVTEADLERADLVLAMAREHLRHAVVLAPVAWPRAFTIRELLRRSTATGPRRPGESLAGWLARLHQGRQRMDLLGDSPGDDVPDPTGGPPGGYLVTAALLDELTRSLVTAAWSASTA